MDEEANTEPTIKYSRRTFLAAAAAIELGGFAFAQSAPANATIVQTDFSTLPPYGNGLIPQGIRSRQIANVNGLNMHILEAGYETLGRPTVVLLHGFPELAYSWRKIMMPLASAGFHVIAPDRRGHGRTTGWDNSYDTDIFQFGYLGQVRDTLALVSALGYRSVDAVVGHDAGSPIAAWCSVARPDVFRSVVMMSSTFSGPPTLPFNTANSSAPAHVELTDAELDAQLAALPQPRKYYQTYNRTRQANNDFMNPSQGPQAFWRAYYYFKSGDYKGNKPFTLKGRTAEEFAKMPKYYVMDLDKTMPQTVAPEMPNAAYIASCKWLTDADIGVYVTEYSRTGFQGGLNGYRIMTDPRCNAELLTFSGHTIDVPSFFIAGTSDWNVYQRPGSLELMQKKICTHVVGVHLIDGVGHWAEEEQPAKVSELLIQFLHDLPRYKT